MTLGRDLITALGLDINLSENFITGGKGPYEGCSSFMVDLSIYNFTPIIDNAVKPEESFIS